MQHFLDLADHSSEELWSLLKLATHLKTEWRAGGNKPVFKGKTLAMVFQKPSLRTRVSFEMGMQHLGGHAMYLSPSEIGLGKRESIADVARVLSGYVQGIMARVFDHAHILGLAEWSGVPIINGLSDYNHPCQAMADMLTIYETFGRLKDLTLTYLGDSNNVTTSLWIACAKLGIHLRVGSPEGYNMPGAVIGRGTDFAVKSGATLELFDDAEQAISGADVVYTDTWTSMGQEAEAQQRREVFPPFQVNAELLTHAEPHAIVMHCLPAHRGEEITDEVADGPQSMLFQQAENRLHAQKAILVELMR